ncbi:hypothetical protein [Pseudomonas syringae]|uniref:hypothetical protein n=1 Tax=Pseudomonas syringae TaxID=317 RepID=UPI003D8016FB
MSKTLAALAIGLLTLTAYADDKPLKVGTTAALRTGDHQQRRSVLEKVQKLR